MQGSKTMSMKCQLKVLKADGSVEEYLHTKVMGAISNALGRADQLDFYTAEQLAQAVTFFLYHKNNRRSVPADEILSIIKAVLASTGHEASALAISEHHLDRKLKRCRIEVISLDTSKLVDAEMLGSTEEAPKPNRWDKSIIVRDLLKKHKLSRQAARTIAAMVEQKIINMKVTVVSVGLIEQLVLADTIAVLRAQRQLQTV